MSVSLPDAGRPCPSDCVFLLLRGQPTLLVRFVLRWRTRPGCAGPKASRMHAGRATYRREPCSGSAGPRARALPPRQGSINVGSGREFRPTFPRVAIVTLDLSPWRGSADHDPFYLSLSFFLSRTARRDRPHVNLLARTTFFERGRSLTGVGDNNASKGRVFSEKLARNLINNVKK